MKEAWTLEVSSRSTLKVDIPATSLLAQIMENPPRVPKIVYNFVQVLLNFETRYLDKLRLAWYKNP